MGGKFAQLLRIDNDGPITKETDYEFVYEFEHALLLALRERGTLNAMQFRIAQEKLKQKRISRARKLLERSASQ